MKKYSSEIIDFIKHLRIHYQFLLISGTYLLGGVFSSNQNITMFIIQYLSVHIFLFGGTTAYNSFWDKDEGPIGGLKNPPKMKQWMHIASLIVQIIGLILAFLVNYYFVLLYLGSMLLSIIYSHPKIRWKGHSVLSFIPIGLGTLFSFYMGYVAYGGNEINIFNLLGGIGSTLIILSMYPISQIYQSEMDIIKGDKTFANQYSLGTVRKFFVVTYLIGLIMSAISFSIFSILLSILTLVLGTPLMLFINAKLKNMKGNIHDYSLVMRIKYFTSLALTLLVLIILVCRILKIF